MKKAIAALYITAAMAAGSAQAGPIDLTSFSLSGTGGIGANYAVMSGTSSITGVVSNMTSFDWNFTAKDYLPFNDYSYFITTSFGTVYLASVSAVGDYGTTGWRTYNVGAPYSGVLTFGIKDALDQNLASQLEVRNVMAAVPEPEAITMMLAGLALVGGMARRRARSAA